MSVVSKRLPEQSIKYRYAIILHCEQVSTYRATKDKFQDYKFTCLRTEIKNASSCAYFQKKSETNLKLVDIHFNRRTSRLKAMVTSRKWKKTHQAEDLFEVLFQFAFKA